MSAVISVTCTGPARCTWKGETVGFSSRFQQGGCPLFLCFHLGDPAPPVSFPSSSPPACVSLCPSPPPLSPFASLPFILATALLPKNAFSFFSLLLLIVQTFYLKTNVSFRIITDSCTKSLAASALAGVAHGLSATLRSERSPVRFLVRAHAWVAGRVPRWGRVRGNPCFSHTLTFLSLSFFFPSLPSKNKQKTF